MNLKPLVTGAAVLLSASLADAATLNLGPATLSYDETTDFSFISSWFQSGSTYGFDWAVPASVQVASSGALVTTFVSLPTFTLTANAGYDLSGAVNAFLGNLTFIEYGGATTGILAYADVAIDAAPAVNLLNGYGVAWTANPPSAVPGLSTGYFGDTLPVPVGSFNSLTISNAFIVLSATGGVFSSITSQPQNKLEFSFTAVPVPEPETYAMLLSGIAVIGWVSRRRRQR